MVQNRKQRLNRERTERLFTEAMHNRNIEQCVI